MTRWLKEPLLHFLLIGAGLFLLYGWQTDDDALRPDQIVFTEAKIDQFINLWERKWQRLPTQQELQGLIEQQVREEVLYREALAMGLDKNDQVVRRRMSQKMEFISNDLASLVEPDDEQLQTYLDEHSDKFAIPGRISYSQVYLNVSQRGEQVYADAERLLAELSRSTVDIDISMAGDSFMGGYSFNNETDFGVARLFDVEGTADGDAERCGNPQAHRPGRGTPGGVPHRGLGQAGGRDLIAILQPALPALCDLLADERRGRLGRAAGIARGS